MLKDPKSFLSFVLEQVLRLLLFVFIFSAAVYQTAGTSDKLKSLINQNDAYARFVPAVIADNKAAQQPGASIDYKDKEVARIFLESFPTKDIQTKTESIIDGTYDWLSQETPVLSTTIDISNNKLLLADNISSYAFNRLAALPKCTAAPESVNPLTIGCNPGDYDPVEGRMAYRFELLTSDTFLPKTVFGVKDLPKNAAGKTIVDQFSFAPVVYQLIDDSLLTIFLLFILLAIGYISLSSRRRRGVASFAMLLISTGSGLVITPVIFNIILPSITKSMQSGYGGTQTQKLLEEILTRVTRQFIILVIVYGVAVTAIGIIIYLFEKSSRPTTKYSRLSKRTGLSTSIERLKPDDPRNMRGKLSAATVPLQTSDASKKVVLKASKQAAKYRKVYEKKGL